MLEDFTYDSLLQICEEVQGKVKVYKEKKISYQHCQKVMWKELCILWDFTYARVVVCVW